MAVQRQQNFLGQQRVDVPHLRSVESSICADFDVLAGRILAGRSPLVSQGFVVVTTGVGQADQLQLIVADSILIHHEASESGSIFHVPADRAVETLSATISTRVSGSFVPNQVNYVGVDLRRTTDQSTNDLAMFIDTTSLTETPREVPMARTLDYVIVITTTDFSSNPNLAPIAKVTTGANNAVLSIEDARNIAWRLGAGGAVPNTQNAFPWPAGRNEGGNADGFTGGDKAITCFKEWADAVMSRMWEQAGGEYWYSPTADRNVKIVRTGTAFASTGENFEWDGTNLHWKGLVAVFDNSTAHANIISDQLTDSAGLTDLADGECIYVDFVRTAATTLTAVKGTLSQMGAPTVPGSRWVIAWRYGANVYTRDHGWAVGSSFKIATVLQCGTVCLSASDSGPGGDVAPRVTTCNSDTSFARAYAGGMTRGAAVEDFFAGAGSIDIGGQDNDHSVNVGVSRSQDSFTVYGPQITLADDRATVEFTNTANSVANADNQIMRLLSHNESTGIDELAVTVDSNGALGFRNILNTVVVRDAGGADKIKSKLYFKSGDASYPQPNVKYADGYEHPVAMNGGHTRTRWEANALNIDTALTGSYFNDFCGDAPTGKLATTGTASSAPSSTHRGGVLSLTAAVGGGSITWSGSPDETTVFYQIANPATESWDFSFRAKFDQGLTAASFHIMGWTSGDRLHFNSAGLNFRNNAGSVYLTSWTPDTNWHVFRCAYRPSVGTIRIWVDGVSVYNSADPVAGLNTNPAYLIAMVSNIAGTAQIMHLDKAFCAFGEP